MHVQSVNNYNNTSFRGTLKSNEFLKKVETYVADQYCHPVDKKLFNDALDYIKNKTHKSDIIELGMKNISYATEKPDTAVVYRNGKPVAEWWIDRTTYGNTIGQEERGFIGALCECVGKIKSERI